MKLLAVALAIVTGPVFAQAPASKCDPAPARAVSVQGSVEARPAGASDWHAVRLNDSFCPGDQIRVLARSRADVALLNQSVLRLNANSAITVEAPREQRTGVVDLVRGAVHFFSRGPNSLDVKTPFTVAGVRGTEFYINVEPQRTLLTVFEGTVAADNPTGNLLLRDGQSALAEAGKPPVLRTVVRPRDAVQWALYYPPVLQNPKAPAYRAQTLLAVGAVDEARSDIQRALQTAPNDPDALSLQSIMALVQGDKDQALQLAQAAVTANPNSASALIARSYAEQARFDLEAARASVQRAVEVEPNNALAWARLAELHSALGERDKALSAAQRAAQIDPNLSRTQTVLGFARLTSIQIAQAKQSFEKAIGLDQADPLPRLGLGLAKIRDGDLGGGSRDIEIAASLDPSNALVRSYLGKAYYEEKRSPLDQRELAMAKQLDPKDPTPWFYDAIAKQTTNRPVEALQDLEKARELNDNRAVYRSQLLLDSDAAARAASQARVYGELGFQQRALVEGWSALNRDPSNFSAHRFLADSYAVLPRHEIARVSELLQSQLLSPVTNTPLQPRLAESNLALISSAGPGVASFNEFNPLFNRDGATVLFSGMAGSNNTDAAEGIVSGIVGKAGYSLGYSQFGTAGFRTNSDQKDQLGNAFVQYDFTPDTSAQFEWRHRDTKQGDLQMRFFPTAFNTGLRNEIQSDTYRLGGRHSLSPNSVLLGSVMVQDRFTVEHIDQPPITTDRRGPDNAVSTELQHIYRATRFTLTSGLGYFKINGHVDSSLTTAGFSIPVPFPPFIILVPPSTTTSSTPTDIEHVNLYGYANYSLTKTVMLTGGLSIDSVNGSSLTVGKHDQANPKIGVVWSPTLTTTVRAAAFRTYKRTLITDQTLEPTQVAGFNQFFDDVNGTKAWRYGAGVDQRFGGNVFGGVEASKRKLDSPFTVGTTLNEEKIDEWAARAYAYWTPRNWLALRSDYLYDKWERRDGLPGRPTDLKTHRVPLAASVFHGSAWSAGLVATYVKQEGQFLQGPGNSSFWLTDIGVKYRLPKRHGFISAGVRNAGDKSFQFFDIDPKNPQFLPVRMAYIQGTLTFP